MLFIAYIYIGLLFTAYASIYLKLIAYIWVLIGWDVVNWNENDVNLMSCVLAVLEFIHVLEYYTNACEKYLRIRKVYELE